MGVCLNCVRKGLNIASSKSNAHTRKVLLINPGSLTPFVSFLEYFCCCSCLFFTLYCL